MRIQASDAPNAHSSAVTVARQDARRRTPPARRPPARRPPARPSRAASPSPSNRPASRRAGPAIWTTRQKAERDAAAAARRRGPGPRGGPRRRRRHAGWRRLVRLRDRAGRPAIRGGGEVPVRISPAARPRKPSATPRRCAPPPWPRPNRPVRIARSPRRPRPSRPPPGPSWRTARRVERRARAAAPDSRRTPIRSAAGSCSERVSAGTAPVRSRRDRTPARGGTTIHARVMAPHAPVQRLRQLLGRGRPLRVGRTRRRSESSETASAFHALPVKYRRALSDPRRKGPAGRDRRPGRDRWRRHRVAGPGSAGARRGGGGSRTAARVPGRAGADPAAARPRPPRWNGCASGWRRPRSRWRAATPGPPPRGCTSWSSRRASRPGTTPSPYQQRRADAGAGPAARRGARCRPSATWCACCRRGPDKPYFVPAHRAMVDLALETRQIRPRLLTVLAGLSPGGRAARGQRRRAGVPARARRATRRGDLERRRRRASPRCRAPRACTPAAAYFRGPDRRAPGPLRRGPRRLLRDPARQGRRQPGLQHRWPLLPAAGPGPPGAGPHRPRAGPLRRGLLLLLLRPRGLGPPGRGAVRGRLVDVPEGRGAGGPGLRRQLRSHLPRFAAAARGGAAAGEHRPALVRLRRRPGRGGGAGVDLRAAAEAGGARRPPIRRWPGR